MSVRVMHSMRFVTRCSLLMVVGCVPYQTYQQTEEELSRAKEANEDLRKKYESAMLQLVGKDKTGAPVNAAFQDELERLRAENADLRKRASQLEFTAEDARKAGVPTEKGGLQIGADLLFDEGSDKFKAGAPQVLDGILSMLKQDYPGEFVIIEGHTDNQPLVQTKALWKFNMRLAYARAEAVFMYCMSHGIPESQLLIRAYSFNKPTAAETADTKAGQDKNRRVVFRRGGKDTSGL